MELRDLSLALRRHWLAALLAFAVCFGLGAALVLLPEKTYATTAVVAVRPAPTAPTSQNAIQTANFLLPTYVEQLGSRTFYTAVSASLPPEVAGAEVDIDPSSDIGTGLLRVRVASPDPGAAAAWATALATQLVADATLRDGTLLQLSVLEEAAVPSAPESNAQTTLIAFFVLGLIAATLAAAVRHKMAEALDAVDDVRRRLDAPVLGEIPRFRGLRSSSLSLDDFLRAGPRDVLESFQTMRTNVELAMLETRPDVIAITSLTAGEGKSTVAAALAVSMASVGQQVTLIDADLRQPTVHERLGEPFGEGLANVTADPHHLVRELRSGLRFLPAGVPDRHPADVITFALPRALDALRRDGALIVIDGPPLRGIAETRYITTVAHHVILVVDATGSNLPEIERAMARLREAGVVLLGVVLNRTRRRRVGNMRSYYEYDYQQRTEKPAARRAMTFVIGDRKRSAPPGGAISSPRNP